MVASQFYKSAGNTLQKPFENQLLLQMGPTDILALDHVEFDFADVFGPAPNIAPQNLRFEDSVNMVAALDDNELVYHDPAVIYSRSHSLVGPTTYVSQSFKLSRLSLHETNYEFKEEVNSSVLKKYQESSIGCAVLEKYTVEADGNTHNDQIGLDDFEVLKVVGQGAFGKVYQVRKRNSLDIFAMKVMRKDKIMEKNHVEYMKAEREILTKVDHPFIVQLRYSFQTRYKLYLVLDFVNGGHLFFQLYRQGLFREDLARFYSAEIVSAVSHLHANGIMHRDLKPENILLDAQGHAMLTDFGLAKQFDENTRFNSMCGTLEYISPEILLGKGHDKAADWWSVGILLYKMLTGKLLQKEPSKRLGSGSGGSEEIKWHKWFRSIKWSKLEERKVEPSFLPEVGGKQCIANFEECWTNMPLLDSPVNSPKCSENPFEGYTHVKPAAPFLS